MEVVVETIRPAVYINESEMTRSDDFVAVPTTFYLSGLENYVRGHVKSKSTFFAPERPIMALDQPGGEPELEHVTLELAEALMIGDSVALSVTGENVHLAYLARMFGAHDTAELIRCGAIEFVGEGDQTGSLVDPSAVRQGDGTPVEPGNPVMVTFKWAAREPHAYDEAGLDPEASAIFGLRRFATELGLDRRESRELIRRTARHTHVVPLDRVSKVVSRVQAAYANGALEQLGLSPKIARDTNIFQDNAVAELATRISYVENLLDFELDQYQMPMQWTDIMAFTREASSGPDVLRAVDRIMELRRAPDLRALFRDRILKIKDIPRLRVHPATKNFRRWLWSKPDPRDAEAIVDEFIRDIANVDQQTARTYMKRVASVAAITFTQDRSLDALQLSPEVRIGADIALGIGQLLASDVLAKFKIRPPSGFFDQLIEPALNRGSVTS